MAPKKKRKQLTRTNPLTSLVLVLPLVVIYELGVLFVDVVNGADFLTGLALRWFGLNGFLLAQAVLLLILLVTVLYLRRRHRFELKQLVPTLMESAVYALTMGTLIIFVMVDLLSIDPRLATGSTPTGTFREQSLLASVILSIGAGVYEELVFRFVLMGGFLLFVERGLGMRRWVALLLAVATSSVIFALAHHVGPYGEPLAIGALVYRTLAGVVFGLIYHFRSLATAVYTHTFYDIYVLLMPR